MTKKEKVKKAIEYVEYYTNGFNRLCGHSVTVKNLRLTKNKAVADVVLSDDENTKTFYGGCEYSLDNLLLRTGELSW